MTMTMTMTATMMTFMINLRDSLMRADPCYNMNAAQLTDEAIQELSKAPRADRRVCMVLVWVA